MSHTIVGKKKLLNRVRRIKGQTIALENVLEGEANCMAVLQQVAAIKRTELPARPEFLSRRPCSFEGLQYHSGTQKLADTTIVCFITAEKGGVARAKGGGENEKECTTECKSRRRRDDKAPWALKNTSTCKKTER